MISENKSFLQFVDFATVDSWSTYSLLETKLVYTQKYPFVKIGNFLKRDKTQVKIEDSILYKRATIRMNTKGILLRDVKEGKQIGTKNQYRIKTGQFLMSKIDARNGAFGVVPETLNDGVITGNFWAFEVDYNQVNPHYLTLVAGTKEFQNLSQTASVGTTNRNYLQESSFLNFKIPLPSLSEQRVIIDAYSKKIKEAELLIQRAQNLNQEIHRYLFEELRISESKKIEKVGGLSTIEFSSIDRWGVEYNLGNSSDLLFHSKMYTNEKLKNVLSINPITPFPKDTDILISFIPMQSVSDEYGVVTSIMSKSIQEVKGYTKFKENDLIWARITPCMENGKSAIVKGLKNGLGVGSTEFHVLRNYRDDISLDYIYHFLRLDIVLQDAKSHFTGSAGQQRVPKSYLEELSIPFPGYSKQIEISDYLYDLKNEMKSLYTKAEKLKEIANKQFENTIFN